jgi:hypothetical protein
MIKEEKKETDIKIEFVTFYFATYKHKDNIIIFAHVQKKTKQQFLGKN